MIIDSHVHAPFLKNGEVDKFIDELLKSMEIAGVQKTTLMPSGNFIPYRYPNKEDIILQAEILSRISKEHPNAFFPLLYVSPTLPFNFLKEIVDKYILDGPITGIKLTIQMKASDIRLKPFASYLERHNIPLLFHSWYKTVTEFIFESEPPDIAVLAKNHPELRILMAHLTGNKFKGVQDIKACPNILIDTSGSQPEAGHMEYALKELGADRILFGSDYPGRDIGTQLGRIESVDLSKEEKEKILYKNALNFYTR